MSITYNSDTFNQHLTDFAVGLWPTLCQGTVAEFVAPTVAVEGTDGDYCDFDRGIPFSYLDTRVGEDAEMRIVKFNAERKQFRIKPHGLKIIVPDFSKAQAAGMER